MITRREPRWFEEDGDLQVFVPGLMATGILVSVGMFVWDGVRKLFPDIGRRRQAARLTMRSAGRVNDLASIDAGEAPEPAHVARVRRTRSAALLLAISALAVGAAISVVTLAAYNSGEGTLAGRGWTLSMGFSVVAALVLSSAMWLCAALMGEQLPSWPHRAQARWPIGVLPEPTEADA